MSTHSKIIHGDHTLHDWKIFLAIVAACALVIGAAHAYLIYRVNQGDIFTVDAGTRDDSITQQKILVHRVNAAFEKRQTALDDFNTNPPQETDPSL